MESVYGTDYSENEYCEEPAETADAGVTSGNGLETQACGKSYQRKIYKQGAVWMCATYLRQGKLHCPTAKQISERILYEKICSVLQIKEFDVGIVKSKVKNILVSPNRLIFLFKDNTENNIPWENHSRSESWTSEMRQAATERSRKCQK